MPNEPLYQFYETVPDIGGEERIVREEGSPDIKDHTSLGGNLTQHRSCLSRLSSGQQSAELTEFQMMVTFSKLMEPA